jgi:hypothetical protein
VAETNPKTYILGIIVFAIIIFAGTGMLGILDNGTGVFSSDSRYTNFTKQFNKSNELYSGTSSLSQTLNETSGENGLSSLVTGAWRSVSLVGTSFGFMNSIWVATTQLLGIPVEIAGFVVLMVTIIIIFAIWSAIFQTNW